MNDTKLSSSTNISDYEKYEKNESKDDIANFLLERFTERYITPLCGDPKKKHGFTTMAISCLMIETLESFRQGREDTSGKSKQMFHDFFAYCQNENRALGQFSECSEDFYYGVRCGILHQAETTNGWKIIRRGALVNFEEKTINATSFHNEMEASLKLYCDDLRTSDWNSEVWMNARKKMKKIIENCYPQKDKK